MKKFQQVLQRTIIILILVIACVIALFPFYWLLTSMFKAPTEIFSKSLSIFPKNITLENVIGLFSQTSYARSLFNSLFDSLLYTFGGVIICSMAGFALAKFQAKFKNVIFGIVISALLIPPSVLVVPLFILISKLGMVNTYFSIIFPTMASSFGVFWMKQYISDLPDEILHAARIDGAGDFRIYISILIPTIKSGLAALAIYLFMQQWNDFLWPLVVLRTEKMYTIPIALSMLKGVYSQEWGQLIAGAAISVFPLVILFLCMQRYFIAGVMAGSIKE